jgi:hypothetical protein
LIAIDFDARTTDSGPLGKPDILRAPPALSTLEKEVWAYTITAAEYSVLFPETSPRAPWKFRKCVFTEKKKCCGAAPNKKRAEAALLQSRFVAVGTRSSIGDRWPIEGDLL